MRFACLPLLLALAACGPVPADPTPDVFIALQKDFSGFKTWSKVDLGVGEPNDVHSAGHRIVYLNHKPDHGSTTFPVGTVIVKTIDEDAATPGKTFAMAKRGGGFNTVGATGWEWFELEKSTEGTPLIVWRGITPPSGEGYGGAITGGACNTCHMGSSDNDFVSASALKLSTF